MKYIWVITVMLVSNMVHATNITSQNITFVSQNTQLAGSLVLPANEKAVAGVIFVHGSGKQTRFTQLAERFAENGIAALVYDKRGVGESKGKYESKQPVSEQNLNLLAQDAAAALNVLVAHPKLQGVPIGMTGLSQAGWIVPLAAVKNTATQFIVLWSGPVSKVSEEDILSIYTKNKDSDEVPSFAQALAARKTPYIWPEFLGKDTDTNESLRQLEIPGLWVFGEKDGSIPVDLSVSNIKQLNMQGHAYEYVLFSSAGHMNIRQSLSMAIDWIKACC